jgi:hypothetical protein
MNILDTIQLGYENPADVPPYVTTRPALAPYAPTPALVRANYPDPSGTELFKFFSERTPRELQDAIELHLRDMRNGNRATNQQSKQLAYDYSDFIPHHLIYAYFIEYTGIARMMWELLYRFELDESLTKVGRIGPVNIHDLLHNTEQIFFKDWGAASVNAGITSAVRSDSSATRANAYHRLLGLSSVQNYGTTTASKPYLPKEHSNSSLTATLQRFFQLFWDAYENADNSSGANSTNMISISKEMEDIRLMLMARRSADQFFTVGNYSSYHLTRVEVTSVIMMLWLRFLVNPNSPFTAYLRLDGNTPGDVLKQLQARLFPVATEHTPKVHSKSNELFQLADSMMGFLRNIEMGFYEQPDVLVDIIKVNARNYNPTSGLAPAVLKGQQAELLTIIHNWSITVPGFVLRKAIPVRPVV